MPSKIKWMFVSTLLLLQLSACTPTVHLVVDKPIEINMNITVEIKIAVEKDLDEMLNEESGLF